MKFRKVITNSKHLFANLINLEVFPVTDTVEHNVLYFCNNYDVHSLNEIRNILPMSHWTNLSNDRTSVFLFESAREPVNLQMLVEEISYLISSYDIKEDQFYIILHDLLFVDRLKEIFSFNSIFNVRIDYYSHWLYSVTKPSSNALLKSRLNNNKKKFSILSRNYKIERLKLFLELLNKDLLDHFNYTFHNIHPYGEIIEFPKEELKKLIPAGYNTSKIEKWIDGIPYSMEKSGLPSDISKNEYILNSFIHVNIETLYSNGHDEVSWITEKTYKTIMCKRPFIIYSTVNSIKDLNKLGYKSFHPYINETYDSIADNDMRLRTIVDEIKRIAELSNRDFFDLINNCKEIVEYNYNVMNEYQRTPNLTWLNEVS